MESLTVVVIYKIISDLFGVIEKGWFATALTENFLLRVSHIVFWGKTMCLSG